MYKVVIADDETDALSYLESIIHQYFPEIEIVGMASSVKETEELILMHKPKLVFLDIQMPGGDVFDMLENISFKTFDVIFVTAYDNYAIKALKLSAIDYLLKPIDIDEFKKAVKRFEKRLGKGLMEGNKFMALLKNVENKVPQKISLYTQDKILYLKIMDIIRFEGDGSYSHVITIQKENHIISKRIKDYQDLLLDYPFYRIHNSYLINIEHVKAVLYNVPAVVMTDNVVIPMSRKKKNEFLMLLSFYSK
jgi:two-component system LytT family response regulator